MTQVVLKQGGGGDDLRYFVKPGLAGGQIGYGGLAAGENLTLGSTADVTKGKILFGLSNYDDAVNLLNLESGNTLPVLGAEMIANAVDRDFSGPGNWTGTNWTVGGGVFTHTPGSNQASLAAAFLTTPIVNDGRSYQITLTLVTTTVGSISVRLGGSTSKLFGQVVGTLQVAVVLEPGGLTGPQLSPDSNWAGTVDDISLKEIIPSTPALHIRNAGQSNGMEFRAGGNGLESVAIGLNAMRSMWLGGNNVAIGAQAMRRSTLASLNVAIGGQAMQLNATGSYNVAIGNQCLRDNAIGNGNFAMGNWTLRNNVSGNENIGIGREVMTTMVYGNYNIGIGSYTLAASLGTGNVAIGRYAMINGSTGNYNVGVGVEALRAVGAANNNVALGYQAAYNVAGLAGSDNIIIGYQAAYTGTALVGGGRNIVIGYQAGAHTSSMSNCLNIGNLIYGTALDGTGLTRSTGNVGIGSKVQTAGLTYGRLNVAGDLLLVGDSTTQERERAALKAIVVDNTDATRKYGARLSAWDTAERIALEVAASGTAPMIGFLGTAAVVKAAALTAGLTLITHTAPGTPDYAIQDLTAGGFGFVTKDEGNTMLSVVLNLQTRVAELESRLQAYGLLN